jgi:hypothetical protein
MVALLRSSFPWFMILGVLIVLAFPLASILRFKNPLIAYEKLIYQSGTWFLQFANGEENRYEEAFIAFDGGLFILLRLKTDASSLDKNDSQVPYEGLGLRKKQLKRLVIFKDQMSTDEYRALKWSILIDTAENQ